MKKFVILLFIFCLSYNFAFAKDDSITLNLFENSNKVASEKLYEFMIKEYGRPKWKINELWDITKKNTYADFVDLNDDGTPEVVGFTNALISWGTVGTSLYILKINKKGKYEDIYDSFSFYPQGNIKILKEKINNFHNIEIIAQYNQPMKFYKYIIKFDGKFYNKPIRIKNGEMF